MTFDLSDPSGSDREPVVESLLIETGVRIDHSRCPLEAEDRDHFDDEDGCPDEDNDGDGIIDALDAAPNLPEDFDEFQDHDGRPDLDNDFDGIPDAADNCPYFYNPDQTNSDTDAQGDAEDDTDDMEAAPDQSQDQQQDMAEAQVAMDDQEHLDDVVSIAVPFVAFAYLGVRYGPEVMEFLGR